MKHTIEAESRIQKAGFPISNSISIVDIDSGWINHFIQYMDNFVCSMCQTILINGQCWASSRVCRTDWKKISCFIHHKSLHCSPCHHLLPLENHKSKTFKYVPAFFFLFYDSRAHPYLILPSFSYAAVPPPIV